MSSRQATHAGSWYSDDIAVLKEKLESYILRTKPADHKVHGARIIISPHAGYSYSGPTAAYGFKALDLSHVQRIFILGPSHHFYLSGCALSQCTSYKTPLGELQIDTETIAKLHATRRFDKMSLDVDEDEHSIEMQLPFLKLIMGDRDLPIVPILVGNLSYEGECEYGGLLQDFIADASNAFVLSSDFCHWGGRFNYKYYHAPPEAPVKSLRSEKNLPIQIWESIELMDKEGIRMVEAQSHKEFSDYLVRTKNTICGRHPIGVMLAALERTKLPGAWRLLDYRQSNRVVQASDGSVSYVSEIFVPR